MKAISLKTRLNSADCNYGEGQECFFSILGKQGLSQSAHNSKRRLKEFLLNYIAGNNENPRPFVWTKGPEKLQRIIEATKEYQAAHPHKPRRRRRSRNTIKN